MASPASDPGPASGPEERSADGAKSAGSAKDASPLYLVAGRDVALVALALSLFAAADAWYALTGTVFSAALAIVDGLVAGFAVSALAHEWGHFIGARQGGAAAPLRPVAKFLPLFDYDYQRNDARAFMAMSIGGNAAHWLAFALLAFALPLATPGQAAVVAASFGFGVFSSSIEFPVIWRARNGASPIEALSGIPKDFLRRNGLLGLLAAAIALVALV